MADHELKTWPGPFQAVWVGDKRFEVRRNDRDFKVGDTLLLREWVLGDVRDDPQDGYTGREILVEITYLTSGQWGLPDWLAVMSIRPIRKSGWDSAGASRMGRP